MVCILTLPLSETNWNNYFRCILEEIDRQTNNTDALVISNSGQVQTLIRAAEDRLRGNITNSAAQIIGQVIVSQSALQTGLIQSENNVRGTINSALGATLVNLQGVQNNINNNVNNALNNNQIQTNNIITNAQNFINQRLFEATGTLQSQIISSAQSVQNTVNEVTGNIESFVAGIPAAITAAIEDIIAALQSLFDPFINFLRDNILRFGEVLEQNREKLETQVHQFFTNWMEIARKISRGEYRSFDQLQSDLQLTNIQPDLFSNFIQFLTILPLITEISGGMLQPFHTQLRYLLNEEYRPEILNPPDVIRNFFIHPENTDFLRSELAKAGLSEARIDLIIETARPLLGVSEVQTAFLRGVFNEQDNDNKLSQLGFRQSDIEVLKQLYFAIPPIQDLIRFAVREVFSPDVRTRFQLDSDYPSDLTPIAKQVGLSEEWSKNYWAAHWDLPSPSMGFEMFHRRVIDEDTLKLLLRALDVMPFWRDKLIQISYNPMTRVDVRRMYADGVLTSDEVYESYLDIGYSPVNARRLTTWTVALGRAANEEEDNPLKTLTQSAITKAYLRELITKDEAINRLIEIGFRSTDAELILEIETFNQNSDNRAVKEQDLYDQLAKVAINGYKKRLLSADDAKEYLQEAGYVDSEIQLLLSIADIEFEAGFKQSVLDAVQQAFIENTIDELELRNILTLNDFTSGEVDRIFGQLSLAQSLQFRKPSRTDFRDFYRRGIIGVEEYINELRGLGYPDKYVGMYIAIEVGVIE